MVTPRGASVSDAQTEDVERLKAELDESRKDNLRLQDKLNKARTSIDDLVAERDRERLRAQSLQKTSQQLLRQLKRETARAQDLDGQLTRFLLDGEWKETDDADPDTAPASAQLELGDGVEGVTTPRSGAGKLPDSGFRGKDIDISSGGGRSWEFVVQGQHDSAKQDDFVSKTVSYFPDDAMARASNHYVASVCSRGRRLDRSVPNQDDFVFARHTLADGGHIALYGVFDGHGPAGHHCAAFARRTLPESLFGQRALLSKPEETLREAFHQTQVNLLEQPFDTHHSGTTAVVALVLNLPSSLSAQLDVGQEPTLAGESWLFVAHVGDSRAILASQKCNDASAFTVTALTHDHRPDDIDEAERIRQAGGEIRKLHASSDAARVFVPGRSKPGLALTRCFGASSAAVCGVTAEPEVSAFRLRPSVDLLLVLGTDGLFEFCTNSSAAEHVIKNGVSSEALEALCADARDQWTRSSFNHTVDDITVIAASLRPVSVESTQNG